MVEKQKWKDRALEIGVKYEYPKKEYDFLKIKENEFNGFIKKSDKTSVVKALAIELGLGGKYAEEVCALSNVDKDKKLKELEAKEVKKLFESVKKIVDKKTDNLSGEIEKSLKKDKKPVKSKEHEKIIKRIKKQEEHIFKVKKDIEENNKKAELIYKKYKLVDEILKEIKKAREKYSWKEIEKRIKGNEIIKKVNSKESKVIVDLRP